MLRLWGVTGLQSGTQDTEISLLLRRGHRFWRGHFVCWDAATAGRSVFLLSIGGQGGRAGEPGTQRCRGWLSVSSTLVGGAEGSDAVW